MLDLKPLLTNARTIAVVGCSDNPTRTSFVIAQYLHEAGYQVIPINPYIEDCNGIKAYARLQDLPDDMHVDIVNIFRAPRYTADMVQMVFDYAERTGTRPTVWTQLGVSSEEAQQLAEVEDLPYVKNRCIMIEHQRL